MATVTVEQNFAYSYRDINLNDVVAAGEVGLSSYFGFVVAYDSGYTGTFVGAFSYNPAGYPNGGVVTSYGLYSGITNLFRIGSVLFNATDMMAAARTVSQVDDFALFGRALAGNDTLTGANLGDRLDGFGGNDRIAGGLGNDTVYGGEGNDVIAGGAGADLLSGDAGRDVFVYTTPADSTRLASDLIRGFASGTDRISLATLDADTDGTAGNQAFSFIGTRAFSGVDGQLRLSALGIEGDTNGDRVADLVIRLGGAAVGVDDLIL